MDGGARPGYRVSAMARDDVMCSLLVVFVIATASGCGRRPPNATPDGVVRELVDRMRRVQGDTGDAKLAFALLSRRTQANLEARAKRYSAASGKAITPEAMIVPWRFVTYFEPQRYAAQVLGNSARVEAIGPLASNRAEVACVFEDGGWRVDLPLPALRPLQARPGAH
jgi:hypothetical protein